jgi:hypothetical protein
MKEAEAMARKFEADALHSLRADQSERVEQKLRGAREQVEQLHKQGNHEAAEKLMKEAEAMARKFEAGSLRADQSERVEQKLRSARARVDQLRAQGDHEAAEKAMRDAEAAASKYKEQVDSSHRDSSDDLRAGMRQLQRELQELREQFRQLQEQRGSNRN